MSTFRILNGDALEMLRTLPDESVHCCVTSPPYWGLRDYGVEGQIGLEETPDAYVGRMVEVFREVRRALRDDGTLWLNLGDSYAGGTRDHNSFRRDRAHVCVPRMGFAQGLKPKDLVGIPWRVAFALQADGWWLRSDIVWSKPNPMPESVRDRPTKAHEYVFLLSKSERYYYDADAIAERSVCDHPSGNGYGRPEQISRGGLGQDKGWEPTETRNRRTVWEITTRPYPAAHFAVFPPELPEVCIQAGSSERGCCPECGAPWDRNIEGVSPDGRRGTMKGGKFYDENGRPLVGDNMFDHGVRGSFTAPTPGEGGRRTIKRETTGWAPTCEHDTEPVPCTVLDPFAGSGTTGMVATGHGRHAILIELNPEYCDLIRQRIGPMLEVA